MTLSAAFARQLRARRGCCHSVFLCKWAGNFELRVANACKGLYKVTVAACCRMLHHVQVPGCPDPGPCRHLSSRWRRGGRRVSMHFACRVGAGHAAASCLVEFFGIFTRSALGPSTRSPGAVPRHVWQSLTGGPSRQDFRPIQGLV